MSTQWLGAQDAVCMEPDGRWPQIQPWVDSRLLITLCDNRRPPPSHPLWLGRWTATGKVCLEGVPYEVPWWPCLSLSGSWTVCGGSGIRMMEKATMTNDYFFLSFPFFCITHWSAEHDLICREGSGRSEIWCLLIQPHFLACLPRIPSKGRRQH